MTRIAYLVTSAREMTLADGSPHPTGYFAEEALKPYERFVAAGFDVTVITPDGNPPYADPYGLSWFFHYPEPDKDYLASVVRTFAHDVDDIRLTLHEQSSAWPPPGAWPRCCKPRAIPRRRRTGSSARRPRPRGGRTGS